MSTALNHFYYVRRSLTDFIQQSYYLGTQEPPRCMELEASQQPATGRYPESRLPTTSLKYILILSFPLHLGLPISLFPADFDQKLRKAIFLTSTAQWSSNPCKRPA
jgi:hypothetical protein